MVVMARGTGTLRAKLAMYLFHYRNPPYTTTEVISEDSTPNRFDHAETRSRSTNSRETSCQSRKIFWIWKYSLAKQFWCGQKWKDGNVTMQKTWSVDFEVKVNDRSCYRHADQMKRQSYGTAVLPKSQRFIPRHSSSTTKPVALLIPKHKKWLLKLKRYHNQQETGVHQNSWTLITLGRGSVHVYRL